MGKGSFEGIKITGLMWEIIRAQERRQARVDKLHSMGYDVQCIEGEWMYRLHAYEGTDHHWTKMDNENYEPPVILDDFRK